MTQAGALSRSAEDDSPRGTAAAALPPGDLLSVVLEDYFQVAPLRGVIHTAQWYRFETRLETNTEKALALLDEFGIKATFFVLGWIGDEMPEVVREVARRGHEVASKGYYHRSLRQLSPSEFRDDLVRSREALERAAGSSVLGYRIAHGGFGPQDLWALDVLAEEGFAYDSSLRPFLGAFAAEPWRRVAHLHRAGEREIWELPLPSLRLGPWSFPIGGGNYLRQLPHGLMRRAVAHWHRATRAPFVMHFHVWELDAEQPRIRAAPLYERVRQYRNLDRMPELIRFYLERYRFVGIADHLRLTRPPVARPVLDAADAAGMAEGGIPASPAILSSSPERRPAAPPAVRTPVTVVVPCYDEELILPYLANTLGSLEATLAADYALSFVLVDDGSSDATWATLEKLFGARGNCTLLRHPANRGVAAAILTGLARAPSEVVCSIDCDCTYDPHQLAALIPMLKPGVDLVTASPYHPQGRVENVPAWRLLLSKRLSWLYRRVLHHQLATYTSCFRVYRRSSVAGIELSEGGFLGVAEMLGRVDLAGGRIVECPAVLEVRLLGRSKMRTLITIAGHLRLLARLGWARLRGGGAPAAAPAHGAGGKVAAEGRFARREENGT